MFKQDRLENEKKDPLEASSLKFINIPIMLISLLVGFGITYIALKTPNTSMLEGDSRTVSPLAKEAPMSTQENDGNTEGVAPPLSRELDLAELMKRGQQIYTTTCQACHQASGEGLPGVFPPLNGAEWVGGSGKWAVAIALNGVQGEITVKGQKFQSMMPGFRNQFSAEDIASVVTYIRRSFGNDFEPVTVEFVESFKKDLKKDIWNGEAELKAQNWE